MLHPQIDTFIAVAENGSFSKASEKLYLSKVSVMKQIDTLEQRIGIILFHRTNHGVILTSAGKSFLNDVFKLKKASSDAIKNAQKIAGKDTHTIKIATSVLRSCKPLLDIWSKLDDGSYLFQIELVPFNDTPAELDKIFASLGKEIDLIVGGIGTEKQMLGHQFSILKSAKCCIAMSKKHALAAKEALSWDDLSGETMLLVKRGSTAVLDDLRTEIETRHPAIHLMDMPNPYDVSVFNECEKLGYIMETLDIWSDVHPSLVTLPMDWNYEIPVGIMYAANPTSAAAEFIELISKQKELTR